ncbi:MAG: SDR family oxidoreductase [Acidobacteriota bacterium]
MTRYTFDFDFNPRSLADRSILIAGGAGGLGAATSALLASCGARLTIGYRSNRDRAEALKLALEAGYAASVQLTEGDISDAGTRAAYIEAADSIGEGLYGMVCFAGDPARVKFEDATEADLINSMRENYIAPILLARDAARRMSERRQSGAIVLLSSMQAVAAFEGSINYAAPKTALIQAARVMAKELGCQIRVNVIAPGVNRAGMAMKSIEAGKYDYFVEQKIIPRFGKTEDVARVARLLLEPDNYITGQVITVDGGLTLRRDRG